MTTYRAADGSPLTKSDRCPFCQEFALQEDVCVADGESHPVLYCACCESVTARGHTPLVRVIIELELSPKDTIGLSDEEISGRVKDNLWMYLRGATWTVVREK